jgi:4-aminobutyrate aminotransferase-like enzyme
MDARVRAQKAPANEAEMEDLVVTRAEGSLIFDANGRRYIDFTAGWCVGNLGWGRKDIIAAIRDFDGPTYVYPYYRYQPWTELVDRLTQLAGGRLTQCFRAAGGSEAVDIALQAAILHTGRSKFVAIDGSYHGNAIANRGVGDSDLRGRIPGLRPSSAKIKPPLDATRLGRVEALLSREDVAGFIMEPVICNLGVLIPDRSFMRGVQTLCRRYGTLLIIDEVATGFGRTGRMFGFELYGLKPDIVCLAKAVTAGYAPMGATLTIRAVAAAMQELGVYSTYGWHPLSVAAALANLQIWAEQGDEILANVATIGAFMRERLLQMPFGPQTEVRVQGLAVGVDIGDVERAERIQTRCRENGLLITTEDTTLTLFPALTIDQATAEEGLRILEQCL